MLRRVHFKVWLVSLSVFLLVVPLVVMSQPNTISHGTNPPEERVASYTTDISVFERYHGTGSICRIDGPFYTYEYSESDICAGICEEGNSYKGYARFNLEDIPTDLAVTGIEITVTTAVTSEDEDHRLLITSLPLDPEVYNSNEVWNAEYSDYLDEAVDVLGELGASTIYLNDDAIHELQVALDNEEQYWGVIFLEESGAGARGQLAGWETDSPPFCSISLLAAPAAPSSFVTTIDTQRDAIILNWTDNSIEESRFRIDRRFDQDGDDDDRDDNLDWTEWVLIAIVETNTTTYTDESINSSGTYQYRIRAENRAGHSDWISARIDYNDVPELSGSNQPINSRIDATYPNPFNSRVEARYSIGDPGAVSFTVYNMNGQKVMERALGYLAHGEYAESFELNHMATGVYLLRLNANGQSDQRKIMLIK